MTAAMINRRTISAPTAMPTTAACVMEPVLAEVLELALLASKAVRETGEVAVDEDTPGVVLVVVV
jgi:hypothetical protein